MPRHPKTLFGTSLPIIIGLSGRKRSGKDTVAATIRKEFRQDYISSRYNTYAFADDLKELVAAAFNLGDPTTAFSDKNKEVGIGTWDDRGERITPRSLLQAIGTGGVRAVFGPDFWVERLMKSIERDRTSTQGQGAIITDCRFLNEVDAIHAAGGVVVRLNRSDAGALHQYVPDAERADHCAYGSQDWGDCPGLPRASHPTNCLAGHASETELPFDGAIYDHVVTASSADAAGTDVVAWLRNLGS